MALLERQVALAIAATAAALSPEVRQSLRRGAVYGLAGALKAGDFVAATAKGAVRGAQEAVASDSDSPSAGAAGARRGG
jgi:hypothetical protein